MRLKVVYEQNDLVIGKNDEDQLYVGGKNEDGSRQFMKIKSYSLKFNGEQELDSYVLEDGSRVSTDAERAREIIAADQNDDWDTL